MLLGDFALDLQKTLNQFFSKWSLLTLSTSNGSSCHFSSDSNNSYHFEGLLLENVIIKKVTHFENLFILTHFASTGHKW